MISPALDGTFSDFFCSACWELRGKKKCEKCERLCFPGRVHRPGAEALWKGVAARIRFTLSDSKSRNDFLALRFGQTTTDTQWWRGGGVGGEAGALQLCKHVQQQSFDFTFVSRQKWSHAFCLSRLWNEGKRSASVDGLKTTSWPQYYSLWSSKSSKRW